MKRINVNSTNSKLIGKRLFITGLKLSKLGEAQTQEIVRGSTIKHPTLGLLYEYQGPYSRS